MSYSHMFRNENLWNFYGTFYSSFLRIIDEDKKFLNKTELKQKKIIVTNFELFFLCRDDKFSLWSQMIDFPKVFWDFEKWTFIFVHF
jgi:hypothetical protein